MSKQFFCACIIWLIGCHTAYTFDLVIAYQKALTYNADYLAASAQNDAGQELEVQGKAQLLPQLSAAGSINEAYLTASGMAVSFYQPSTTAQLKQVVYDFNKFSTYGKNKFATQLSDLEFNNARLQLMVKVVQAYFELLYAEDYLQATVMTKNALNKQLEDANKSFKIGSIMIADVNDAKSGYDSASAQQIQAENEVINRKNMFTNVTGLNPDMAQPVIESIDLVYPAPDDIEEWVHMAKAGNLDIKIATKKMEMAIKDIDIAKSGHLPVVSFQGTYTIQGTANVTSTDSGATMQLVNTLQAIPGFPLSSYSNAVAMLQISIPISSGGGVSSQIRQQISNYEVARDNLLSKEREVDKEVRNAFLQVRNGVEIVSAEAQALKSARIKLQSDTTGYKIGVRNSINLVNSQRNYYQTWQSYNKARYTYLASRVQLEYLTGKIDQGFLQVINNNIKQ